METYNNLWIYAPDTSTVVPLMKFLPKVWKSPDTGKSYSSMHLFSEVKLNEIGWYKIMELHDEIPPTEYQKESMQSFTFREQSQTFLAEYVVVYRDLEDVRSTKLNSLNNELYEFIEDKLDNIPDVVKWVNSYRAIAKLIEHTSPLVPAIANDAFLQGIVTKVAPLVAKASNVNSRITTVTGSNDIETIIGAK